MPSYPLTVMDLFSQTDPGRRLTDPSVAYQAMQLEFGWQVIVGTSGGPGPLASMAVNVVHGPAVGTGNNLSFQLPFALGGRELKVINLSASTIEPTLQYNPAIGRLDQLVISAGQLPLTIGSVTTFLSYEPGFWLLMPTYAAAPASEELDAPA